MADPPEADIDPEPLVTAKLTGIPEAGPAEVDAMTVSDVLKAIPCGVDWLSPDTFVRLERGGVATVTLIVKACDNEPTVAVTCTVPLALAVNVTLVDAVPSPPEVPLVGFTVAAFEGETAQFTVLPCNGLLLLSATFTTSGWASMAPALAL